ncbi:hypothetical protein EON63_24705 [archaeon]|nr:MAG: hypothetical protein EON63_24705 [archaeon]
MHTMGASRQLGVYLPDSDERAVGYLSGPAPNKYGIFHDGQTLGDKIYQLTNMKDTRYSQPLFGYALLQVLGEVVNRRLFSVVREERRLTYDASFELKGGEQGVSCVLHIIHILPV